MVLSIYKMLRGQKRRERPRNRLSIYDPSVTKTTHKQSTYETTQSQYRNPIHLAMHMRSASGTEARACRVGRTVVAQVARGAAVTVSPLYVLSSGEAKPKEQVRRR